MSILSSVALLIIKSMLMPHQNIFHVSVFRTDSLLLMNEDIEF